MYYIFSCNPIYVLKFIVHKINSEIVKFGMVVLTGERRLTWLILMRLWAGCFRLVQAIVGALVVEREREN
jgi:hypothetical protein